MEVPLWHERALEGMKSLHIGVFQRIARTRAYPQWVRRMFP